ncbi:MAG: pyridoxamine 5'-phosphate oxidase family protein [Clostridiales bacterium]
MRRKEREVKDAQGITEILAKTSVCSIAMVDNGAPYIVPLNYGYVLEGETLTLYFHCASKGRKLDILKNNPHVGFETHWEGELKGSDKPCTYTISYGDVIGTGEAIFVENDDEKAFALKTLMQHLTAKDFEFEEKSLKSVFVFKIVSTDFCGKKN